MLRGMMTSSQLLRDSHFVSIAAVNGACAGAFSGQMMMHDNNHDDDAPVLKGNVVIDRSHGVIKHC
jgi:hypothetical protein